ncbi:MAG: hypothetical protein PHO34_04205 [Candidatus Omnitrophica bacterium]|jgi:hypothetical protein|nr:hypothetical protein [Candidatus Omnitrophota bacterium]MDD5042456.1 hypothetical protein [Candidatus Omnitrophota bacterium]MDD5501143.1 hypothetical protein [Candidatus Omnitrophota bacterium]
MGEGKMLVKNQPLGNVFKCPGGIVHINVGGVSLHFEEHVFLEFAGMVKEASSRLIDEGLKSILEDG